jgi:lipid A disaccharide synthetase
VKPKTFMLIAGEASGDLLAAELVSALRGKLPDATPICHFAGFLRRGRREDGRRRSRTGV